MPLSEVKRQAARLKKGDIDVLHVPAFRGGYRGIATDINAGIQRVVEKGGGTARKPADLESILGPVPAQPNMSAFSFPMADGSMAPQQVPQVPQGPAFANPGAPASAPNRFPGAPPPPQSRPNTGPQPGAPPVPPPARPVSAPERTVSMANAPLTPGYGMPAPVGGPPPPSPAPTAPAPRPPAPNPPPPQKKVAKEDEETMVAQPPADLLAATGASANETTAEWHKVYEEFIRTKRECGEPTEGLTFEKFQQTLKKNRDALLQRHGCKRVKFSVYVKEGRASLKATPVRE